MYYGLQNTCADQTALNNDSAYSFNARARIAPGTENIGTIFAISVETGKTLWKYEQRAGIMSAVATGGGLIFAGDTNGHFRAFDQQNGAVLWDINLGSPVTGYPITYSVRGKQYVAVLVGARNSAAVISTSPELKNNATASMLFVFGL
jgi:alcohol dehydrogenase (cytochrome c)